MAIHLTSVGTTALLAHEEFDKKYRAEHGELPFWKRHKWITSSWKTRADGATEIHGPIGECPVTQEELNSYAEQRDTYIAEQILYKHGWIEFVRHCESADLIQKHTPCEAESGQCHMDCKFFGRCDELWASLKESHC